jgi:16S rRNA (uracil1498-N3)-methyltransferase
VHVVMTLAQWLKTQDPSAAARSQRLLLSLRPESLGLREAAHPKASEITFLSGPEGGLSTAEEDAALAQGFAPVTLGPRVLRSETAALAALAALLM